MATAFSCDGSGVITRKVDLDYHSHGGAESYSDIESTFEIEKCVHWIDDGCYKMVALQFPDILLAQSTVVSKTLMQQCEDTNMCVLADTSYGSCCVDEVAAQHYNADAMIHFGHACLSPTRRLPVLYVFGQSSIKPDECLKCVKKHLPDKEKNLLLMYDVSFFYVREVIQTSLLEYYKQLIVSDLILPVDHVATRESVCDKKHQTSEKQANCFSIFGRKWYIPHVKIMDDYDVLYIGNESHTLTNMMMTFNKCTFHTYNPQINHCRVENISVNKKLMKRYYLVERTKDANIVGIVVATLGVSDYISSINRLKEIIRLAGKKSYTFVMGKLNVAKLANFMEVDIYVIVACPENSLLDNSEFCRPVITPYELEIALNPDRDWTGEYTSDFRDLLPGGSSFVSLPDNTQPVIRDISLVTGGMRSLGLETDDTSTVEATGVLCKNSISTVASQSNAAQFLSHRQWQGLEQHLGDMPVVEAIKGGEGIAMSYKHEPKS